MERKIIEIRTEEKNGEFVIRLSGERAAEMAKCLNDARICCCCCRGESEKEAAAGCC